jgi:type IV pilus assembly protein PilA
VKPCPYCAKAIEDYAQVCPFCGRNLVAPGSAPPGIYGAMPPGNVGTSGKAIGSLVCGILFFFLPAAIAAVVLGHLSLSEIRQSAGRLAGRGMAIAGLVLGYLGLSFIPILIIAAIAIPNLLRAKMAANEASAVASLRTINTACVTYATEHKSFPSALANVGPAAHPGTDASDLINGDLASGQKSGYLFTYEPGPMQDGAIISYEVHADPVTPEATGRRHFFTDQTGIIRSTLHVQANSESPPMQ